MANDVIDESKTPLPGPVAAPLARAMAGLPTLWGRLRLGLHNGRDQLVAAIREADAIDSAILAEIRQAGTVATDQERETFLMMLVSAWPNASQNDLAGYGLQLSQDVEVQRPSRYALNEASRMLRRTMRFLPSISEVLDAIAVADKRMASVMSTIDKIPAALFEARSELET